VSEVLHVFTSAAVNYLPKVRILCRSIKQFHPEAVVHLALADERPQWLRTEDEPFDSILEIGQLDIPDFRRWSFTHSIVELSTAFSTYARDPKTLALTFGLSVPAHLCIFLSFYFTARAFGVFSGIGGMMELLAVLPIILTIASLPISLSGVGVREGLFQNVLASLYGTPESLAVMISITGFLIVVFWGLVGGCVYLVYRPTGGLHLEEVQDEVHAVEESIEDKA
jgi:hypothetical protein